MKIIWLSSYPKSGNTYVRFLLYNYLFGEVKASRDVEQRIPDVYLLETSNIKLNENSEDCLLMKTHLYYSNKHPYISSSHQFIYILRNPRDIIHSGVNYMLRKQATLEEKRQFIEDFLQFHGSSLWGGFGSWPEHFSSWLSGLTFIPGLFVKYEDLKTRPEQEMVRIITFLGGQVDPDKIRSAVQASSLNAMKKVEEIDKQLGLVQQGTFRKHRDSDSFIGEAKSNQSLDIFGADLEAKFQERFGRFLNLFGYE